MKKNNIIKNLGFITRSTGKIPEWLKGYPDYKDQIKVIREALGMTQGFLAKKVDRTPRSIRTIENGEAFPRITTLQRIAEALNSDLKILIIPKDDFKEPTLNDTAEEKKPVPDFKKTESDHSGPHPSYEKPDFLIGVND
jgi:transcriptional regulator with XRE-family HTH domain